MVVLIKGIWWAFHCSLSIKSFFNLFWVFSWSHELYLYPNDWRMWSNETEGNLAGKGKDFL